MTESAPKNTDPPQLTALGNPGMSIYAPTMDAHQAMVVGLLSVQKEIKNPARDAKNPHFGNTYASLEGIVAHAREVLPEHGFAFTQVIYPHVEGDVIVTMLMHEGGGVIVSSSSIPSNISQAQQYVGFITYMRRAQLTSMLGIHGEEDDDGNTAVGRATSEPAVAATPPAVTQPAAQPPVQAAQAPAVAPVQTAQAPAVAPVQAAQPAAQPPVQAAQPAAQPTPAGVAAATVAPAKDPNDPLSDEQVAEGRQVFTTFAEVFGARITQQVMGVYGITDAIQIPASHYEMRMGEIANYCTSKKKVLNRAPGTIPTITDAV